MMVDNKHIFNFHKNGKLNHLDYIKKHIYHIFIQLIILILIRMSKVVKKLFSRKNMIVIYIKFNKKKIRIKKIILCFKKIQKMVNIQH